MRIRAGKVTIRLNRAGIAAITHVRLLRVGNAVLNNSRRRVNVDTGELRSTGALEDHGSFLRVVYRARHAALVHDGWKNNKTGASYRGNPYLTGAVREVLRRYAKR